MRETPAVYCLCNTVTGECYVGQALHPARRRRDHFSALRSGRHQVKSLQASFDAYGELVFAWQILEECPLTLECQLLRLWLAKTEAAYIAKLNSTFNVLKNVNVLPWATDALKRKLEKLLECS